MIAMLQRTVRSQGTQTVYVEVDRGDGEKMVLRAECNNGIGTSEEPGRL